MYLKFQVQSKAGTIFSLLPFSFSYLTEVLSPQSLAIGYQLPAEPETKLSLKQRGEKREKSTKESWSQLLLGSPAGSVARTKARGCCCFCASCHRPAKPPGARRGTACFQSIPTTAFSHALLSQELQQTHPNSWNGQKKTHMGGGRITTTGTGDSRQELAVHGHDVPVASHRGERQSWGPPPSPSAHPHI